MTPAGPDPGDMMLWTYKEAAYRLGVSVRTIRRWVAGGLVKPTVWRVNGARYIRFQPEALPRFDSCEPVRKTYERRAESYSGQKRTHPGNWLEAFR